MSTVPQCRTVTVYTSRGDRTSAFNQQVFRALDDERNGRGPGPSATDCLLFAGHTGVSTDAGVPVLGFNPNGGHDPVWQVMDNLRNGLAYPGVVTDDTAVFTEAGKRGLTVLTFDVILPDPVFRTFRKTLNAELKQGRYRYGFPDGDGDCNCTTWLERLGLPLLTGRMDEFTAVSGVAGRMRRRFGLCV